MDGEAEQKHVCEESGQIRLESVHTYAGVRYSFHLLEHNLQSRRTNFKKILKSKSHIRLSDYLTLNVAPIAFAAEYLGG